MVNLFCNDSLKQLKLMADNSVDSIITDPPYGLSFMGKKWDYDVPSEEIWKECLRVLKPGGTALIFAGSRTQHRMAVRVEDAGFMLKDTIMWVYGTGFPKAADISKQIDKRGGKNISWFGKWLKDWRKDNNITQKSVSVLFPSKTGGLTGCVANWELGLNIPTIEQFNTICSHFDLPFKSIEELERKVIGSKKSGCFNSSEDRHTIGATNAVDVEITTSATDEAKLWDGWKSHALKPAYEPILVCMKPNDGTYANNALTHGVSGLNIADCRVPIEGEDTRSAGNRTSTFGNMDTISGGDGSGGYTPAKEGRFPANLIHDGSDEVISLFPNDAQRFFYTAKPSKKERDYGMSTFEYKQASGLPMRSKDGNRGGEGIDGTKTDRNTVRKNVHPTVKPISLMEYLCKLTSTPTGGVILDPFMGSGTTGIAAVNTNRDFIGIELSSEYFRIATERIYQAIDDNKEKNNVL